MKRSLSILMVILLGSVLQSIAQGDLLITQKRVVFEGNKQKEALDLVNIGKDTAVFAISFVQYRQTEDGAYVEVDKPDSGQMFADPYLRIFPRKVILAPAEPQVVKLQCRRKPDMAPGEYRSHLYFRAEKNIKPLGAENSPKDTALSVQLIPIFGITIPIIIHSGDVHVNATLSNLKIETKADSIQLVKLTINRTGNISIYGDFTIEYVPERGKTVEIGLVKGVGVYTTTNKRNISIRPNKTAGIPLTSGKLRVKYLSNDDKKKIETYAEAELELK